MNTLNRYKITVFLPFPPPRGMEKQSVTIYFLSMIEAINHVKEKLNPRFFQIECLD